MEGRKQGRPEKGTASTDILNDMQMLELQEEYRYNTVTTVGQLAEAYGLSKSQLFQLAYKMGWKRPGKNPGEVTKKGRSKKYPDPEALQMAIDDYFESCWASVEATGSHIRKKRIKPYTISGLANALGLSRPALLAYQGDPEFADVVNSAKMVVHEYVESFLFSGKNSYGAIFSLKNNFGWKDKQEHELSGPDGSPLAIEVVFEDSTKSTDEDSE